MNKIYLVLYNKERKFYFTKYFSSIKEKDKYLRKIKYVRTLLLIEDSEDINYNLDKGE
ncbi:MAG: hypothetical protein IKI95_05960 [Clostridia bacterium]|nr:hypothetical protein [Clostridia bacterium]